MTIKQHGGVFGRNPSFNDVSVETLSIAGTVLSSTAAELNILDGVTADATELNYLDGASTSAVVASKAVLADSSGNIPFPTGKGIDFSADPSAAGMTSELLDDYEEGTWTIGVAFGGASVGITYGSFTGYYTKVGSLVTVTGYCTLTNKGSSTGAMTITGLPFTAANNAANYSAGALWTDAITFAGIQQAYVNVNTTTIAFFNTATTGSSTALTDVNFSSSSRFMISLAYRAT